MNNEPVAWTNGHGIFDIYVSDVCTIPLYTAEQFHPAKTLTDEEINDIWLSVGGGYPFKWEFIRAILRKAQEK